MTVHELYALFKCHRLASDTETTLQLAIASLFTANKVEFQREFRLNATDRPDFIVGKTAIEVKIDGSISEVSRQLHRYAQHPDVESILLVTTRSTHIGCPRRLNGKQVVICWIGGNAL